MSRQAVACALVFSSLLASCAPGLRDRAVEHAAAALRCAPGGLLVREVGRLQVRPTAPVEVTAFDAEGCDRQERVFCTTGAQVRCDTALSSLVEPALAPVVERALRLLVTASRGRCPGETLAVVQESESLFVFEACDGRFAYHCRQRGCEWLRPRGPG